MASGPSSPHHIAEVTDAGRPVIVVCNEGYSSSLAAATLRKLGLHRPTDLAGGYQALRSAPTVETAALRRDRRHGRCP